MFLRILAIITYLPLFLSQNTNVTLPKPKIETRNLESVLFQNGQRLKIIRETDQDFETSWAKNSENPTVLITRSDEYLYNYNSIVDERNICPTGFRVIAKSDVENFATHKTTKYNIYISKYSNDLEIYPSPILEPEGCGNEINLYTPNLPHIAVNDIKPPKIENGKIKGSMTPVLYWDTNKSKISLGARNDNIGLPVRCIENIDFNNYFNNNVFKYNELRSNNWQVLQDSIQRNIQFSSRVSESMNVELIFSFKENGRLVTVYPQDVDLLKFIPKTASKILEPPFYEEIKIKTVDTLSYRIIPYNREDTVVIWDLKLTSKTFQNYLKVNSLALSKNLENCMNLEAEAVLKYPNNILVYKGQTLVSMQTPSLKKVICPGPINALYSVIPGLGIYQFKQTGFSHRKLLGTSLSLAAIGIASKAISISYYNRFRYNLDGPESAKNYQIANTSQKVFVVSSALYAGLALVDFTWTFSLGVKSKNLQYKTNKELRTMHKQNLWL